MSPRRACLSSRFGAKVEAMLQRSRLSIELLKYFKKQCCREYSLYRSWTKWVLGEKIWSKSRSNVIETSLSIEVLKYFQIISKSNVAGLSSLYRSWTKLVLEEKIWSKSKSNVAAKTLSIEVWKYLKILKSILKVF